MPQVSHSLLLSEPIATANCGRCIVEPPALARPFGLRAISALLLLLMFSFATSLWAEASTSRSLLFDRVGDADQVKDGVVTGLANDGLGFLWIATTEGLVRYDGYRFRNYVNDRADPSSLPGNVVRVVIRSRDGHVWVGTEAEGVARYDPLADRFERFGSAQGIPSLPVRAMAEDASGGIWIGTTGAGLIRLDPQTGSTTTWRHDATDGRSLPDDRISALAVDRHDQIWVGTWRGLVRISAERRTLNRLLSIPGDSLGFATARIRAIQEVSSGDVWIGAQQGQAAVVPASLVARTAPPEPDEVRRWLGNGFSALAEPIPGEVWLGHSGGIDVHALDGARSLREIRAEPGNTLGLAAAEVRSLLVDASGMLWVGSFGGGLQRTDPRSRGLTSRRYRIGDDPPMPQFNVLTMGSDGEGGLWLGLAGVGIARMRADLSIDAVIKPGNVNAGRFEGDQPAGIATTLDGSLWVATERGLYRRPSMSNRFVRVAAADFLEGSSVRKLWPAGRSALWIGTADGLFRADTSGSAPQRVVGVDGDPILGNIEALQTDSEGAWVGGSMGLLRLDGARLRLTPVPTRVDGSVRVLDINGLLIDASGQLWVDAGGLFRGRLSDTGGMDMDPVSARFGEDNVSFGANLLDDNQGRIWTHRAMFNPATDRFRTLLPADGAQIGTGWFRSYARFAGGRLAFGGREGVLVIDPEEYRPWAFVPPVVITDLRVDGVRAPLGPSARVLRVSPAQRGFAIEFAALDLSAPSRNRYRYRLEGVDDDWIEAPAETRLASYGNLWPGTYTFVVEGSNRLGDWSAEPAQLTVEIEPHWWQTPWFISLLALVLILGTTALIRWRTRSLQGARAQLEQEVLRRTKELRVLSEALRVRTREFEEASLTDPLTGLRNRRFMSLEMASEMALWVRRHPGAENEEARQDMVVFMIDIDHFKSVNDRQGHSAGDELLRQFAGRLRDVFRSSDHLVRWGGEEFLVVARDTTRAGAAELAERVRESIAGQAFITGGAPLKITASLGYAPLPWDASAPMALDWEAVVALADLALYTVKQGGRNGWLGLLPQVPLPANADLAWVLQRLPRMITSGDVALASNLNLDRLAHLIAMQSR